MQLYTTHLEYYSYKHQEDSRTGHYEPILDEYGLLQERENYAVAYISARGTEDDPQLWALACSRTNQAFHKNQSRKDRKSHEYIISHPEEDRPRMTMEDLLNEAAEVDLSQYTEESAEAFRAAYAAAQEVFADETLTEADQQKVDDAVVALKEAKAGLAALAGGSGDGNQSGDTDDGSGASGSENTDKSNGTSGSGDSANRAAKTGDTVPVMGLMMLVIVSGAAAVAAYRKRVK